MNLDEFIGLLLAVAIVIGLAILIGILSKDFLIKDKCDNQMEWDTIKTQLEHIDQIGTPTQIPFRNTQCKLASFNPGQESPLKLSEKHISNKPLMCLCLIEEQQCKPVKKCYQFENIIQIQPFTTIDLEEELIFLKFTKQDSTLIITST